MSSMQQFDMVGLESIALEMSSEGRTAGSANHPIFFFNNDLNNICGMVLVNALVPFTYNTVAEGLNNRMRIIVEANVTVSPTIAACTFILVFKPGNYNLSNATSYIQNEIDNLVAGNPGTKTANGSYCESGDPVNIKSTSASPVRWVLAADPATKKTVFANYRNAAGGNNAGYTSKGVPFKIDFTGTSNAMLQASMNDVFGFNLSQGRTYAAYYDNTTPPGTSATQPVAYTSAAGTSANVAGNVVEAKLGVPLPYFVRASSAEQNALNYGFYVQADEVPNFIGAPKLVLRSNLSALYGSYISPNPGGGYSSGVTSLIVGQNPGRIILYENPHAFFSKFSDRRIDQIELWWTYGNTGIEVDFNGIEWSVEFRLLKRSDTGTNINRNAMGDRAQRTIWTGAK